MAAAIEAQALVASLDEQPERAEALLGLAARRMERALACEERRTGEPARLPGARRGCPATMIVAAFFAGGILGWVYYIGWPLVAR